MKSIRNYSRLFVFVACLLCWTSCSHSFYSEVSHDHVERFHVDADNKMAIATFHAETEEIGAYCTNLFVSSLHSELQAHLIKPFQTDSILDTHQVYSLPHDRKLPPYLLESIESYLGVRYLMISNIKEWTNSTRERRGRIRQVFQVYDLKTRQLIWSSEGNLEMVPPDPNNTIGLLDKADELYGHFLYKTMKKMNKQSNVRRIAFIPKNT